MKKIIIFTSMLIFSFSTLFSQGSVSSDFNWVTEGVKKSTTAFTTCGSTIKMSIETSVNQWLDGNSLKLVTRGDDPAEVNITFDFSTTVQDFELLVANVDNAAPNLAGLVDGIKTVPSSTAASFKTAPYEDYPPLQYVDKTVIFPSNPDHSSIDTKGWLKWKGPIRKIQFTATLSNHEWNMFFEQLKFRCSNE